MVIGMKTGAENTLKKMEEYSRSNSGVHSIPREEGEFFYIIVCLFKPRKILELGTSIGYSTTWLGLAAKEYGGKIKTVEINPDKVAIARKNFDEAGLSKTITVIEGDINKELEKMRGKFDFVFLDSEKKEYLKHFRMLFPHLRKGGLVAADNAGTHELQMRDYLWHVRNSKGLASVFVPIGNGVELTVKK